MTVQEAKEILGSGNIITANCRSISITNKARDIAIECMEQVEQYRALGYVEELKEAREKQVAKSPTLEGDGYCPEGNLVYDTWYCPNCDKSYEVDYDDYDYCPNCGQAIDKSEMGD